MGMTIINNYEMPANCYMCDLQNYHECDLTGESIEEDYCWNGDSREKHCPLKEVPSGKWIPVTEIQNMRKEMSTISRVTDGERDILFTCLAMIDDLIEGYFEEQTGENT